MFSRRQFLKNLSKAGMYLPLAKILSSHSKAFSQGSSYPLRFIALFSPHGTIRRFWKPKKMGAGHTFDYEHSILKPLEKYKNKMILLDGIDYQSLYKTGNSGHEGGMATALTGCRTNELGPLASDCIHGSIDQYIASTIGADTRFSSLELGVGSEAGTSVYDTLCFGKGGTRLSNIIDPNKLFSKLFQSTPSNPSSKNLKDSLIEFALKDLSRLKSNVSGEIKSIVDVHQESLFELQKNISIINSEGSCSTTGLDSSFLDPKKAENFPKISKNLIDQMSVALHCQMTNVASFQIHHAGSDYHHPFLNSNINSHNDIAHKIPHKHWFSTATPEAIESEMLKLQSWYTEQVLYLLDKLSSLPEGDGSLLDNTVILWVNELGHASTHGNMNVPITILGGRGKKTTQGKWLQFSQDDNQDCHYYFAEEKCLDSASSYSLHKPHNNVLTSILKLYGINTNYFGDPNNLGDIPEIYT